MSSEKDQVNEIIQDSGSVYKQKGIVSKVSGLEGTRGVDKNIVAVVAPVKLITYKWADQYGTTRKEETVDLSAEHCPFSKRFGSYETLKECTVRSSHNQVAGKAVLGNALCYPRSYVNHFKTCPHYRRASE